MNTIKNYFAFLTICTLLFTSCSKEESPGIDDPNAEAATLSFATVLNDMINKNSALKQQLDIPECSDGTPAFVEVVLTGPENVGSMEDPLVVSVNPNPGDYDGDSEAEYFTDESTDLELVPGTYTLQWFVVYDGNPDDDSSNRLWIAPREDGELADFVDTPLPQSFNVGAGVKKYVDVEVLCFDDRLVNEYGYLFFDIETNEAIEFCIFGNFCPPSGRHFPAQYSVDVWSYANGQRGAIIHDDLTNTVELDENGDFAGSIVCMALPDTEGLDEYYIEITLLDSDAYGNVEERIIRSGVVNDDEVKSLFDGENNLDYYHFREGCDGDDSPPIFQDPEDDALFYKSCLMPANGSQALGFAYITIDGNQLDATIIGVNLEENRRHAQGIFGAEDGGNATCPPSASDELLLALTSPGGEYPMTTGDLMTYQRSFTLGEGGVISLDDLGPLEDRTVVFHGGTQNSEYNADLPVACGDLFKLDF